MKNLFLFLFFLTTVFTVSAQDEKKELPSTLTRRENKEVFYEKVYPIAGTPKAELYNRAKQWLTANTRTNDNNIVFDDKDNNYINTSTGIILDKVPGVTVNFKITLAFKDDKVKLECPSFTYLNVTQGVIYQHELGTISFGGANKRIYRSFDESFTRFLASFEAAMNSPAKPGADW